MTANDKLYAQRAAKLETETIRNVLSSLTSAEKGEPTPEYPLRGFVHFAMSGRVSVKALETELAHREHKS